MNRHLVIKISCFCVAYMDVGEEREHDSKDVGGRAMSEAIAEGCGSFVKLRKASAPCLRSVGNSSAITRVSRLESEYFNQ
jgi:hypothetical protein